MPVMTPSLDDWNPGLDNDARTLRDAYREMGRCDAPPVPWYVKLLENPASPIALAGAVDLFEHDCIHIALGRGALPADEAFVIGFTMGASRRLSRAQHRLYALCARYVYRGAYRFSPAELAVFEVGVATAAAMRCAQLDRFDFRPWLDRTLGELRAVLGLDTARLREVYERERRAWPDSAAARRLPRPPAAAEAGGGVSRR